VKLILFEEGYMHRKLLLFVIIALLIPLVAISAESKKKIVPAVPSKGDDKGKKKEIKPATIPVEYIKLENLSEIVKKEANSHLEKVKEILKEEVKPKTEFETEETYRKRLEGASAEMITKKIQLIEEAYKKRRLFGIREMPLTLPLYNPEGQYFEIKILTLPVMDNVIYQPPEEGTNLRFVPGENGVDLILKLDIPPEKAKNLREQDKFLRGDVVFTMYLSLKSQEDLNIYTVVAFSDVNVYIKEKDKESTVYKKSLRINTPTFPKRN